MRALLTRAREDERALLDGAAGGDPVGLADAARQVWSWLVEPERRPLLRLWVEGYARSLVDSDGAWAGFGTDTVEDWLTLLARHQPEGERSTPEGAARRTAVLAVLRGALLDLLATGQEARVGAAVELQLDLLDSRA